MEMLMFGWYFMLMLVRDSEDELWSRFVWELVIWTQPWGPLCLWQYFISFIVIGNDMNVLVFFFKQIAEHLGQISNERDLWSTSINFINSVFWSLLKTSLRTTPPCTSRCLVTKIRSSKDEWSTESNNHLWSTDLFRS